MPAVTAAAALKPSYGRAHARARAKIAPLVLAGGVRCARCGDPIATSEQWDLGNVAGDPSRYAGPEHAVCNRATNGRDRFRQLAPVVEDLPEPVGLDSTDRVWRVPWLIGLRRVPRDATWPRFMTVPHPAAAGSLGDEFAGWVTGRTGGE